MELRRRSATRAPDSHARQLQPGKPLTTLGCLPGTTSRPSRSGARPLAPQADEPPAYGARGRAPLIALALAFSVVVGGCTKSNQKKAEDAAADPMAMIARKEQERAAPGAFAAWLADPDEKVRARAVLAVARLEMLPAVTPLASAMKDASSSVRAQAAFGLGQLDLAIDPKVSTHQAVRSQAEKALVEALAKEGDDDVRNAIIRALGRVADTAGLDALVALAKSGNAEAFTALGVSGARRQASRSADAALADAVNKALGDEKLQPAAAYTAFRQKMKLTKDAVTAAMIAKDVQARIFVARDAPNLDEPVAQAVVDAGLRDPDWRVRVEALRASKLANLDAVVAALDDAVQKTVAGQPALAHVVREACSALASSGAGPAQAKPALQKALVTLAKTTDHRGEACACAVALDVIEPAGNAVERCDVDADDATVDRLKVQVAAKSRVSSKEKVGVLAHYLDSEDVKTRMAAANALVNDGSRDAAEVAAKRLIDEEDVGVAGTLVDDLFSSDENADALPDSTLYKIVERFRAGTTFEQAEPLIAVASLARTRQTPTAKAVLNELQGHPEPRVRDAANHVAEGDRAPGARASVLAAPPAASMPMWAMVKTSRGNIRISFDREHAASTVANFVSLAKAHFYDGTPFHRVIADFVAQGGDKRGDGAGGPGYTVNCENSDEPYTRGAVGMATAGKDTGGSQFFFTHSWQPHLDGRYTLFARVVDGLDVMDALQPDDKLLTVDFVFAAPPR